MVETLVHSLALAATVAGAVCLYLTAPHQRWLARARPARPGRTVGALALLAGWLLWSTVLHPVTAAFTSLTVTMMLVTALPFAGAARAMARSRQGG